MKNTRELRVKRPWRIVKPEGYFRGEAYSGDSGYCDDSPESVIKLQSDFLREYYPSGHLINDHVYYPDINKVVEEDMLDSYGNVVLDDEGEAKKVRRYITEYLPRYSFAFQQLITVKQMMHATGYDIQFETTGINSNAQNEINILEMREGWLNRDCEISWYDFVESIKITGDGAIVSFIDEKDGKKIFSSQVYSYKKGDMLYPHYEHGRLSVFARGFKDYDEEGSITTEWLEVWDDTFFYRYKRPTTKATAKERIKGMFSADGFILTDKSPHGFPRIPVTYYRDENGPCWAASQDACDGYELSMSQMAHNNQAFGFPIMHIATDEDVDIRRDLSGSVKDIETGKDDKVEFLSNTSASEAFMKQLDTLYNLIFELSFVVRPPELHSGDLPAAALKILYSPAYEKAHDDAMKLQRPLNDFVECFRFGYGVECKKQLEYENTQMKWWIKPYVHINWTATITDLATSVQNGFLSCQTASERIPEYAVTGEWDRILREGKEKSKQALLDKIEAQKMKLELSQNKVDDGSIQDNGKSEQDVQEVQD